MELYLTTQLTSMLFKECYIRFTILEWAVRLLDSPREAFRFEVGNLDVGRIPAAWSIDTAIQKVN
jgi:hypothetical protein